MFCSSTAAPVQPRLRVRPLLERTLARRPEVWLYAVAGTAGTVLLVPAALGSPAEAGAGGPAWLAAWGGWVLMVLAMMLPVIAPEARRVAMRSLWLRRQRAVVAYLAGYLAVWAVVGAVIVATLHLLHQPHPRTAVTVAALLGAALWQTSSPRRRLLRRCGSLRLGAADGWAADRDCASAGLRAGRLCALTCGPVMVAMAVGHHYPTLMVALLALILTERARGPNPERRAGRPLEAWCLAALASLVGLVALMGGGSTGP